MRTDDPGAGINEGAPCGASVQIEASYHSMVHALLRLERGPASRAHHAPPLCLQPFGGGIAETGIPKGDLPTTS